MCGWFFLFFVLIFSVLRYYHHKISNRMKSLAKSQLEDGEQILLFLHAPVFMTIVYSLVLAVEADCILHIFFMEGIECIDYLFLITVTVLTVLILKYLPRLFKKNFYAVTNMAVKPIEKQDADALPLSDIKDAVFDRKAFLIKSVCVLKKDNTIVKYSYINHSEQFCSYIKSAVEKLAENQQKE